MSTRDELAMAALQAFMSSPTWVKFTDNAASEQGRTFKEYVATECYIMADEMRKASELKL